MVDKVRTRRSVRSTALFNGLLAGGIAFTGPVLSGLFTGDMSKSEFTFVSLICLATILVICVGTWLIVRRRAA